MLLAALIAADAAAAGDAAARSACSELEAQPLNIRHYQRQLDRLEGRIQRLEDRQAERGSALRGLRLTAKRVALEGAARDLEASTTARRACLDQKAARLEEKISPRAARSNAPKRSPRAKRRDRLDGKLAAVQDERADLAPAPETALPPSLSVTEEVAPLAASEREQLAALRRENSALRLEVARLEGDLQEKNNKFLRLWLKGPPLQEECPLERASSPPPPPPPEVVVIAPPPPPPPPPGPAVTLLRGESVGDVAAIYQAMTSQRGASVGDSARSACSSYASG